MEELVLFQAALDRLESSPYDAALQVSPFHPVAARSREQTLGFLKAFVGPDGLRRLLSEDSPSRWLLEFILANATDELELSWFFSGDMRGILSVMPWVRRILPRPDEYGNPPSSTACLFFPFNSHPIGNAPPKEEADRQVASMPHQVAAQRQNILRTVLDARDTPDLVEGTRRTRQFQHSVRRFASLEGVPCGAVWRVYTWAKRQRHPWATYLKTEWAIDVTKKPPNELTRLDADVLHWGLYVVAFRTLLITGAIVRAVEDAWSDTRLADPCSGALEAASRVLANDWVVTAAMMRFAPLRGQRAIAGKHLAAQVLARISLGHSRGATKVRGRPGKRLDDALHDLSHFDPTLSCTSAHDAALIQEVLSLVWTEPRLQEIGPAVDLTDPEHEARFREIVNSISNQIARKGAARRRRRTAEGESTSERRTVGLISDPVTESPGPLEDLIAREEAESSQHLWDELIALVPLLPPRQRQVAELKLIERLSHPQIAARLDLTEGGSKANWFKAKTNLLRLLRERGHVA